MSSFSVDFLFLSLLFFLFFFLVFRQMKKRRSAARSRYNFSHQSAKEARRPVKGKKGRSPLAPHPSSVPFPPLSNLLPCPLQTRRCPFVHQAKPPFWRYLPPPASCSSEDLPSRAYILDGVCVSRHGLCVVFVLTKNIITGF